MQPVNLRSRHGDGYITLIVVLLPLLLVVMATGIDGLALAASYNRAVGLARVAAQAGATSVDFNGGGVSLNTDACPIACATACDSAGGCSASLTVHCTQQNNTVEVTVSLKPMRVFGGALGPNASFVVARARSSPRFGINAEE
jgi:hypothetical protein